MSDNGGNCFEEDSNSDDEKENANDLAQFKNHVSSDEEGKPQFGQKQQIRPESEEPSRVNRRSQSLSNVNIANKVYKEDE